MHAIRVKTHLQSETLHLPQLKGLIGKDVEIIVFEDVDSNLPDEPEAREDERRVQANAEIGRAIDRDKLKEALRRAAELRAKASPSDLNDE